MADMIATDTYQSGKALLARYDDASHILRSGVALLKWVEADAMATNLDPDNL